MITDEQYQEMQNRLALKRGRALPSSGGGDDGNDVKYESELHEQIIDYCRQRSPQWIVLHGSMAHRTRRTLGECDFVILADKGRVLFIECKRRNGKLSPAQVVMSIRAEELGHKIHVVYSLREFIAIADL